MPGAILLPSFSAALTQEATEASLESYPSAYIIEHILTLSTYLTDLAERTNFFGKPGNDPFCPSLRTLYDRLQNGQLGPSPLDAQFLTEERIKARIVERTPTPVVQRSLADFEDVYYALMARMKDMHQLLNMRIKSGFNEASAPVFEGGPTITDLHDSLSRYWSVLNDPACGKALDDAVRKERAEAMQQEIIAQVQNNELSQKEAEDQIARLWDPPLYNGIQGMVFINSGSPAMIAAALDQKYRVVLRLEKNEGEKHVRQEKRQAKTKAKKNVKSPRQPAERMTVKQVDKQARIEINHRAQQHHQQQMQVHYPVTRHGLDEARLQQTLEHEHAQQEQLHRALEWQMKSQRVSEYRNYLRGRASQDARYAMHNTVHGNDAMGASTGATQANSDGDTKRGHAEF